MPITKLLIANRGEIACRVIRTARALGIRTVAVHSDADVSALHVEMADEAVRIGPAPVAESYLKADAILAAARATGADAIHPGYGFLSENPDFVEAVERAGLIFVGPSATAIRAMGLKDKAKSLMEHSGVPVVPGYHGNTQDPAFLADQAAEIGYPVLIKARAGGGGKGMRLVDNPDAFADALTSARREAEASFGDPACLIEKYIQKPRHIEVQVMGDAHGTVLHLFERDCSLQRRHQKVIEEAPAPGMTDEMRAAMGAAAVAAAKAVDYTGAGTVEFIVDGSDGLRPDRFWFMEMNTRLQVEHPVTEAITGLDLVALQLAIAEGQPLPFAQDDLTIRGHAVEARLYAEDPANGFLPATGALERLTFPATVRIDTGVREGDRITPHYDPMIAKLIATGPDRASALRQLAAALEDTVASGTVTNRAFLARLLRQHDVIAGDVDTGLIARDEAALTQDTPPDALTFALAGIAALRPDRPEAAHFRLFGPARQSVAFEAGAVTVTTEGDTCRVDTPLGPVTLTAPTWNGDRLRVIVDGASETADVSELPGGLEVQRNGVAHLFVRHVSGSGDDGPGDDAVIAPMPGRIVELAAASGDHVARGTRLAVLEAMKMEHALTAPRDGVIAEVTVAEGDQVEQGAILMAFTPETEHSA